MRFEIAEGLRVVREGGLALRRQQAADLKEQTRQKVVESCHQSARDHAMRAQEKREQSKKWSMQRSVFEDEYLRNARAQKAAAEATRKKIKASSRALQRRRQESAQRVRDEVDLDFDSALQNIRNRKAFVRDSYAAKYVDSDAADQYLASPLHKLHSAAKRVLEGIGAALSSSSPEVTGEPDDTAEEDVVDGDGSNDFLSRMRRQSSSAVMQEEDEALHAAEPASVVSA